MLCRLGMDPAYAHQFLLLTFVSLSGDVIVVAVAQNMLNIPFKDCFTVNTCWCESELFALAPCVVIPLAPYLHSPRYLPLQQGGETIRRRIKLHLHGAPKSAGSTRGDELLHGATRLNPDNPQELSRVPEILY